MSQLSPWELTEEIAPHTRNLLLYGPPGTGKTTFAVRVARDQSGEDFAAVTFTEETPAAEVRGHYIPKGGNFDWNDGPGIAAWRDGSVFVINELDHAGGDLLSLCHVLLDDPSSARLTLPSGETIVPAPGYRVIATMNGDPLDLPAALRDRFPVAINITEPHPDALAMLPDDIREAAIATVTAPDARRRVGLRQWIAYSDLRDKVGHDVAMQAVFGERAGDISTAVRLSAVVA